MSVNLVPARLTLHRVAAHVLGRRRHDVTGRFGLRPSPGGFATPAFGERDAVEVVRVADGVLVRETASGAAYLPIAGATVRGLAAFAGTDIASKFSVGADTPELDDVDAALDLDRQAARALADWFSLGARALDAVLAALPPSAAPAVVQLWPEHFDLGTNVVAGGGERVNLGASPGDAFSDEPYLYVGPWGAERPGDQAFWNAPFGAVLRAGDVRDTDAVGAGVQFFGAGLARLG
jgi:hypothetical protein